MTAPLESGAQIILVSGTILSDQLEVIVSGEDGQLDVMDSSITVTTVEGGVTGPPGPKGDSVDVRWDDEPPPPDAPGDEGDLWVVL